MKSLALRLTLLGFFLAAAGAAVYFSWTSKTSAHRAAAAAAGFDQLAVAAERDLLELRAAQQGYVAAGQGDQFWASRVDTTAARLREALAALRTQASSPKAQAGIDNASSALQDFEQMDRRARNYAADGQKLLASDLIFADGLELVNGAAVAVEEARLAERDAHAAATAALERREIAAAGAALAVALIAIGLLVPRGETPAPALDLTPKIAPRAERSSLRLDPGFSAEEGWTPAKVVARARPVAAAAAGPVTAAAQAAKSPASAPAQAPSAAAPSAPPAQAPDLAGVASLCSELARVVDTQALPGLMERAASVLDAPGIVLWIADPDGRELNPIITHGYPAQLVARLGTIPRDAENATASAFRTSLVQTVKGDTVSNGAVAAPLVTPSGCVGVMSAEMRNAGETDPARLAIASIVAAQLATLVGPPAARPQTRVEAAGA